MGQQDSVRPDFKGAGDEKAGREVRCSFRSHRENFARKEGILTVKIHSQDRFSRSCTDHGREVALHLP